MNARSIDPPGAYSPETVDVALLHGRKLVSMYRLGQLWLPTAHRVTGAKVAAGDVKKTRTWNGWSVIVVLGNAGADKRYYDLDSGYLVGMDLVGRGTSSLQASLIGTSFPSLAR